MNMNLIICFSVRDVRINDQEIFLTEQDILNDLQYVNQQVKNHMIDLPAPYGSINIMWSKKEILGIPYFDNLDHVLPSIFYGLHRLKQGEEVEVMMPRTGTIISFKRQNSRLTLQLKRNNESGNFDIRYDLPMQDFIFQMVQVYWRKTRIFGLIGANFTQARDVTPDNIDDLDLVISPDYESLISEWKKFTPDNLLTKEQMNQLESFMKMPIEQWVSTNKSGQTR